MTTTKIVRRPKPGDNPETKSPWRWGAFPKWSPRRAKAMAEDKSTPQRLAAVEAASPQSATSSEIEADDPEPHMRHWSMGIFSPTNPVRLAARRLVRQRWFDPFVDVCIVTNSVTLALREVGIGQLGDACAYSSVGWANDLLFGLDVAFTSVFVSEMLLKFVVHGAWANPGAYLRDGWNWIDAFVATVAVIGLVPAFCSGFGGLSALRAVRLLRTMRGQSAKFAAVRAPPPSAVPLFFAGPLFFAMGACRAAAALLASLRPTPLFLTPATPVDRW